MKLSLILTAVVLTTATLSGCGSEATPANNDLQTMQPFPSPSGG